MKTVVILIVTTLLVACTPSARPKVDLVWPEGLLDCEAYTLRDSNGFNLIVIRCPNSSVSVNQQSGKTRKTVTVIED